MRLFVDACYLLAATFIRELEESHPSIYTKLIRNLLKLNVNRIRRSNREITSLKR